MGAVRLEKSNFTFKTHHGKPLECFLSIQIKGVLPALNKGFRIPPKSARISTEPARKALLLLCIKVKLAWYTGFCNEGGLN